MSTGGMFLATDAPRPPGTEVSLRLVLPETLAEVIIHARVAHVRSVEDADRSRLPAGMGVRFLDLDAPTRAKLEAYVAERMSAPESTGGAAGAPQAALRRGISVLVVDDDLVYQRLAAAAFTQDDRVRFAADGFEALALCGREIPAVVVSDVNMPRMDGWQLLRLLRSKPQYAGVLLLFTTTLSGEADRLRGYKLGVDDYLAKPFRVAELQARVERLLSRAASRRAPPPSPAHAAARSLHGDRGHVSLASVLGLLELERRTGRLTVQSDARGVVTLRDGLLVDAVVAGGKERGRDALFAMLDWTHGDFEFVLEAARADGAPGVRVAQVLLEHAQRTDERRR
jgi:uncharacterized protein (TIGR02266 family)